MIQVIRFVCRFEEDLKRRHESEMHRLQAEEDTVMNIEREAQEARMKEKKVNEAVTSTLNVAHIVPAFYYTLYKNVYGTLKYRNRGRFSGWKALLKRSIKNIILGGWIFMWYQRKRNLINFSGSTRTKRKYQEYIKNGY